MTLPTKTKRSVRVQDGLAGMVPFREIGAFRSSCDMEDARSSCVRSIRGQLFTKLNR